MREVIFYDFFLRYYMFVSLQILEGGRDAESFEKMKLTRVVSSLSAGSRPLHAAGRGHQTTSIILTAVSAGGPDGVRSYARRPLASALRWGMGDA